MGPPPENSHNLMVAQLISPDSKEWNKENIKQTLPDWESEILEFKTSSRGAADSYAWLPSKSGIYTAKSGYYEGLKSTLINSETMSQPIQDERRDFNWKSEIWQLKSSPKTKIFLWKAMKGALPVGENLRVRRIMTDAVCPFCGEDETTVHLFFHCTFAQQVWELGPFKTPIAANRIASFKVGIEITKHLVCLPPCGVGAGPLHAWIIWAIWLARNQKVFQNKPAMPMETMTNAINLAREWQTAQLSDKPLPVRLSPQGQTFEDAETILCRTDATWKPLPNVAGFGWIFSNRTLKIRREGSAASLHVRSPLMAESLAIFYSLQQALHLGFTNLSVASDSKQLIEAINSEQPSMELHGILHDILDLSFNFSKITFNFIPREKNKEADALAKLSLSNFVLET